MSGALAIPDCSVTFCGSNDGISRESEPRILMCANGHYLCRGCFVQLFQKCLLEEPFTMPCPTCRSDAFNEVYYAIASIGPKAQERAPKKFQRF
jgi:hypothetical protein